MDEILITYVNHKRGYRARLRIDSDRHCPFKVLGVTFARMYQDADPNAPDPVYERIMKEREAERKRRRAERK